LRVSIDICEVNLRDIDFQPSRPRLTYGIVLGNPEHASILKDVKILAVRPLFPP